MTEPRAGYPSPATLASDLDPAGLDARDVLERALTAPSQVCDQTVVLCDELGAVSSPAAVLANRAAATALRDVGEPAQALGHARAAMDAAEQIGNPIHRTEAGYTLALCLAAGGLGEDAAQTADVAVARSGGHSLLRARALVQRALIRHRVGLAGWRADYEEALPVLMASRDRFWEALARMNRANALTYVGDLVGARDDLATLLALPGDFLGATFFQITGDHNLGFVETRAGDLAKALERFRRGKSAVLSLGYDEAFWVQDVADALLAAGLHGEAVELLDENLDAAWTTSPLVAPELGLSLARALLADDATAALNVARTAVSSLLQQARPGWALQARAVMVLAQLTLGKGDLAEAIETAAQIEAGGWPSGADEVRAAATTLAADQGDVETARAARATIAPRRDLSLAVNLRVRQAEMAIAAASGQPDEVLRHADAAMSALDDRRVLLGASELRAGVTRLATDLLERATVAALELGDLVRAFDWVDRVRSQALDHPPVVPPGDTELASDLGRLRMMVDTIDEARAEGSPVAQMEADRCELEDRIRQHARTAAGTGIREVNGGRRGAETTEVAWLELSGTLTALVADDDGVRRVDPDVDAATVTTELDALAFAMQRVGRARGPGRRRELAARSLDHSLATLDEALIAPLKLAGDGPVVISPTSVLYDVPWSGLPSLVDRPVAIGPSLRLSRRPAREDVGDGCALVEGPRLDHARQELAALAEVVDDPRLLLGDEATVAATKDALSTAVIAHLACHGVFRSDNPQFSSLELADGPMFVYDLESLDRVPPLLVLSACQTGRSAVHAGDELLGVTASLLALGARHVVAALSDVPDDLAAVLMVAFHEAVAAGASPAAALAQARRHLLDRHPLPAARLTAAAFACIGAP